MQTYSFISNTSLKASESRLVKAIAKAMTRSLIAKGYKRLGNNRWDANRVIGFNLDAKLVANATSAGIKVYDLSQEAVIKKIREGLKATAPARSTRKASSPSPKGKQAPAVVVNPMIVELDLTPWQVCMAKAI